MDKRYIELFKDLAQATAVSAEQVMEYDQKKGDEQGLQTATTMRDDFQDLADRINSDDYKLNKSDAAKLLVSVMIQINQLQDRVEGLRKALSGYQTDVIPKLQAIIDAENDEAVMKLVEENFIIKDNE